MFNWKKKKPVIEIVDILSPIKGRAITLESVPDIAFSSKAMGEGVAIEPTEGKVTAPFAGQVMHIMERSKHAIVLEHPSGVHLLIHVGMDTVTLKGDGFKAYVVSGEKVEAGQLLLEFDIQKITEAGYSTISPIIIPDGQDKIHQVEPVLPNKQTLDAPLLRVSVFI
ncbi:PTS glucose transporter subunit IIA [Paenibacillus illinoisensis]|uniref:PTS sugar transporter subunit IIA n=1 Tax=Paenibacillus illinoisensis TaxID=59845 RepID=UPI003D2C1181